MKRREFVGISDGELASPIGARAQQTHRVRRIGVLMVNAESSKDSLARVIQYVL